MPTLSDIWTTGTQSQGPAREAYLGKDGPVWVRSHWSMQWDDGKDDLTGTGLPVRQRIAQAKGQGKKVIFCAELRHARDETGRILPLQQFGATPFEIDPATDAERIVRRAEEVGADCIEVMNEVFVFKYQPTLSSYEALVGEILQRTNLPVIADFHPSISGDIARACWRLDWHLFPRSSDTLQDKISTLRRFRDAIRGRGGRPTCLEWVTGRPVVGPFTKEGARQYLELHREFDSGGWDPVGVWWGAYPGSERIWRGFGWGEYALWIFTEDEVSLVAESLFGEDGVVTPPAVDLRKSLRETVILFVNALDVLEDDKSLRPNQSKKLKEYRREAVQIRKRLRVRGSKDPDDNGDPDDDPEELAVSSVLVRGRRTQLVRPALDQPNKWSVYGPKTVDLGGKADPETAGFGDTVVQAVADYEKKTGDQLPEGRPLSADDKRAFEWYSSMRATGPTAVRRDHAGGYHAEFYRRGKGSKHTPVGSFLEAVEYFQSQGL